MVQWGLGKWNCEFARLGHYISQKTFEGWHPPSLPLQSHVQRYKGELELCFCIITTNRNKLGVFYKIVYVAIILFLRHNINARLISLPDRQIFRYKDVWICKWDSTSRKNASLIEYKHKEIWNKRNMVEIAVLKISCRRNSRKSSVGLKSKFYRMFKEQSWRKLREDDFRVSSYDNRLTSFSKIFPQPVRRPCLLFFFFAKCIQT